MIERIALIWFVPLLSTGCADIAFPRLLHPGSEEYQQVRAERFDPYPLNDVGPPIVGGRPMAYDVPSPWAERVQNNETYQDRFRQPAPAGLYKPSPGASRQGVIYPVPAAAPLEVGPLMAPSVDPGATFVPPSAGAAGVYVPQEARNWRVAD
ncbi:MAG: hypothetical protein WD845_07205 [Pirellulales bacterium]